MAASDTKLRIIDTSIKLFAQKGYGSTSIREIARVAKTTLPSIYYYFDNKEGLYTYVLRDVMRRFASSVANAATGTDIRGQFINMGKAKCQFIKQNPDIMRLLFRERIGSESNFNMMDEIGPLYTESINMMTQMVSYGIASGEFREIDPEIAARFLLGVFNSYDMEAVSVGRIPTDEEIESTVDLALEAIRKR